MLSQRLKELRARNKMSQKELAAKLFVSQQAVGKGETGKATPNPETIAKISEIFSVSTDYLLGRDEEKPAPISESELDAELIERLTHLTPEEKDKVDAFVQGLLASRSD